MVPPRIWPGLALLFFATALSLHGATEADLRRALFAGGTVQLPAGVIEIAEPIDLPSDLDLAGNPLGTVLRASAAFRGRAVLICRSSARIRLSGFTIDGNRAALEKPVGLPPSHVAFAGFYDHNAILAENTQSLTISALTIRNVAGFAILVSASRDVRIARVTILDSGSRDSRGRNNTSGGILLEEGTADFHVEDCKLRNIRGNGIWTHSMYRSARNRDGRIIANDFENLARDAIQLGHTTDTVVLRNRGRRIGYPAAEVDVEGYGFPVAIDTAGNVERCIYAGNRFEEIDGKCIDLDGFHHGEVRGNSCINRAAPDAYPYGNYGIAMNNANPDMRSEAITITGNTIDGALYGGILVIGAGHVIQRNRLLRLNLARCNGNRARCSYGIEKDPDFLRSGIYLARGAERPDPARGIRIEENEISGYGVAEHCIVAAPGVDRAASTIRRNRCASEPR